MFSNYLKTAYRSIKRHKGYSFINIFGFAIGIMCCILLAVYVLDELSYDRFYPNAERIYRVVNYGVVNGRIDHTARSSPPLARALSGQFPEVEAVTKCRNYGYPVFRYKDKVFSEERVFNVDPSFFDVFKTTFIYGTPGAALEKPDAIVLTRSMAEKYFGDEDPIGKTINSDNRADYIVTAVIEDVPANSHFHYDFLRSLESYKDAKGTIWVFNDFYTYVLLKEGTDIKQLEDKLFTVVKSGIDPFLQQVLGISANQFLKDGGKFSYYFQPLTSIHLQSHLDFELEANGDIMYVYLFSAIGLAILLIACINFINLTTARSSVRSREVGIRKTVGSSQAQIVTQFLIETLLMTILAVCFAWMIAYNAMPLFNHIAGKNLFLPLFSSWWVLPLSLAFAILTGILAGYYPALFLASFKPVKSLKGIDHRGSGRSALRTSLVVVQFAISAALIIATFTVRHQLEYIQNKNLGFNKDQVIIVKKADDLGRNLQAFKEELIKYHGIAAASNSADLFGNPVEVAALTPAGQKEDQAKITCYMSVDPDFLTTYGITLKEGRFLDKERKTDDYHMVLNETAAKAMQLKEPIGTQLINSLFPDQRYPVIGVVEDFHFQSLHQRIQPMVFAPFWNNGIGRYLSVRVHPENIKGTIQYIEDTWQKFAGGQAFEYEFFDDHFARIYLAENQTETIFIAFSILAVMIACLGLFGLAAFIAERRTKEVGVRKVLGASTGGVIYLLVSRFIQWVIIANVIAWPLAWFGMQRWMQGFAYQAGVSVWPFLYSAVLAVMIALIAVSWQAVRAARSNPVDALRYE